MERDDIFWYHVGTLRFAEGVATQNSFPDSWSRFSCFNHQVYQWASIFADKPVCLFPAGDRHLIGLIGKLDPGLAVYGNQLVDASKGRLGPTCNQMRPYAKDINLVPLLFQREEDRFVDIVACHDGKPAKGFNRKSSVILRNSFLVSFEK